MKQTQENKIYVACLASYNSGRLHGEWKSELAFAENIADETILCNSDNETLKRYFDYESFSRDLFLVGYIFADGHVFMAY